MIQEKIKLFWLLIIVMGFIILGTGCQAFAPAYEYKGAVLDPPSPLPDFELKDTNEEPFHLSDVEGNITLVYFGYTFCPDVCPLTLWEIKEALASLESGQERVHVIFITADPERDTPEVLSKYMAVFGPEFIGLTDDMAKIQDVMKAYGAVGEKEEVSEDSSLGYVVSHTASLFLVGPQRHLLLQYPFGFTAEDLSSDLNHLLQQENF